MGMQISHMHVCTRGFWNGGDGGFSMHGMLNADSCFSSFFFGIANPSETDMYNVGNDDEAARLHSLNLGSPHPNFRSAATKRFEF